METFPRSGRMVTIGDVAKQAGCAVSTVSRVLNGSPRTSEATRARVLAAAERLGYRANAAGRSLKTRRSRAVGILLPSITNPVFASALAGIEETARRAGYDIIVVTSNYDAARDEDGVRTLLARGVDGLILTVTDPGRSAALAVAEGADVPTSLLYNQPLGHQPWSAVSVDNRGATAELCRRAIALGHRRIAYISGGFGSSDRARLRYQGYGDAMEAAGLDRLPAIEISFLGDEAETEAELARLLDMGNRPTALLCSNDLLALRVVAASRRRGLSVPAELSVAGFDGIEIGSLVQPSLATIEQPSREMGARAASLLLEQMEGGATTRVTQLLPYSFRPGDTLARAPDGYEAEHGHRSADRTNSFKET